MPARASFHREASSRERIDAAALRLLAEHGYSGLKLQAVADAVGLHKSTLFHHYKGKAELVNHIVLGVLGKIDAHVTPRLSIDEPSLDDLIEVGETLVTFFAKEPAAAKLMFRVVLAPISSPMSPNMYDGHPLVSLLMTLTKWFGAARRRGIIRHVRIRHALMDIIGVLVFQPAAAGQMLYLTGPEPFSEEETEKRKAEVATFIRAALTPTPS